MNLHAQIISTNWLVHALKPNLLACTNQMTDYTWNLTIYLHKLPCTRKFAPVA